MQGDGPSALYPAVRELFVLGKVAEPALVHFIAEPRDATRIERDNALYTILLIHHGNAMDVVQTLTRESKASKDTAAGDHLRDAAKDASKWCDDRIRVKCEDIQR